MSSSCSQILGEMTRKVLNRTPLSNIGTGSVLSSLLKAISPMNTEGRTIYEALYVLADLGIIDELDDMDALNVDGTWDKYND